MESNLPVVSSFYAKALHIFGLLGGMEYYTRPSDLFINSACLSYAEKPGLSRGRGTAFDVP